MGVSAADAAKHMMQVTSLVVDTAVSKVAEEQAKKEDAERELKTVQDDMTKTTANLNAMRSTQQAETPGASSVADVVEAAEGKTETGPSTAEQGRVEGALLRREDEAAQAQKKAEDAERAAAEKITETKKEEHAETQKAEEQAEEKKQEAREEEEKKDNKVEAEAQEAQVEAEKKTEAVAEQHSAAAAQVAAKTAEEAQKTAQSEEVKEKEKVEED